ncbi:MAG TPA: MASE1 domain-containing protein [Xanthobacteraceae bacterium]|nr:MASE1 domain-containing protein [Xanthobacteraceae bacterium]
MSFIAAPDVVVRSSLAWLRDSTVSLQGPALVSLIYFLGAEAAFYIGTLSDRIFALFWPPNVVLFCALLIAPQRRWWLYIAAAFPAHVIAELGVGMPAPQLLVAFATNCMVALLNAYGVRRFVGDPPWFGTFKKASLYIIIAAGVSPALSALGGAFVPILGGGALANYWIYWAHWYVANALPNLTIGPVFLIWFARGKRWGTWVRSRRHIEPAILAALLLGTCIITTQIGGWTTSAFLPLLLFAPLPFVLWAAVRYGEKGASGAILLVTIVLTWRTLHGSGLLLDEDPERSVLALQLFLTGLSIPVLLLGALIDELRGTERTMRELAISVVRAQDEERRRIARDLHDSTGQNLIAATLLLGRIEDVVPAAAKPILGQLEETLQQSIREVRTVSYLLHPPLLDEVGLGPALRCYVDGYSQRSGLAVDLDVAPDVDRLPPDTELAVFRIVQEALTNVSRHSRSPTARIRLARETASDGSNIVLTIEDAGRGMPAISNARALIGRKLGARGVGLASMRERLHQLGGSLEIESAVGRTVVRAIIPARGEAAVQR